MIRIACLLALAATPVAAHEFWLEPEAYRIAIDAPIEARAFNGEYFEGEEFSYNARRWARSGLVIDGAHAALGGEVGMRPAVQAAAWGPGLAVIYHASPMSMLTYDGYAEFETFVRSKRLDAALEEHAARNLPREEIREAYFRYVKALVAVGDGAGEDVAIGMPYELVALDNPYTGAGDVRVRVLRDGAGEPGAKLVVYYRQGGEGGEVEELHLVADAAGVASVPRRPGETMVNATLIERPSDRIAAQSDAHWVTKWAGLTYSTDAD